MVSCGGNSASWDDVPTSSYLSYLKKRKWEMKTLKLLLLYASYPSRLRKQLRHKIMLCSRISTLTTAEKRRCWGWRPRVSLWTYHSVHWQQLVSSFEASVSFSHPSGNDARDINGGILLLASHHVKTEAFICLWQFDYPRVGVAFTSCKSCHCRLKEKMVMW